MFELPDWLEAKRVSDVQMAAAYDAYPARFRAAIKTGIALAHFHFGARTENTLVRRQGKHQGLTISATSSPVPWSLLCLGSNMAAAAKICAAAMLPVLAGVPDILALCCGCPAPAALLTLELCGIEDIVSLEEPDWQKLPAALPKGTGRIFILLGCADWPQINPLKEFAQITALPWHEEAANGQLFLASPKAFEPELLTFAQGKMPETNPLLAQTPEAIYTTLPEEKPAARLNISPGCEGFWSFAGITPEWFRNETLTVQLGQAEA